MLESEILLLPRKKTNFSHDYIIFDIAFDQNLRLDKI